MPRSRYRPGLRNNKYRKGKFAEERTAWVDTALGQLILMIYPEITDLEEDEITESGPTVKILIPRYTGTTVYWDLTHLTSEELEATKQFMDLAFETARPIVEERDRIANEAFSRGDDSFSRVYRAVPKLVVRPRQEREHSEGVLDGPSDVPPSGESDLGPGADGGVRRAGGELADEGQVQGSTEDDGPKAD
jgi:hypothetical protein